MVYKKKTVAEWKAYNLKEKEKVRKMSTAKLLAEKKGFNREYTLVANKELRRRGVMKPTKKKTNSGFAMNKLLWG